MQKEIKRIIEISYKYKLSHVGSCITAYPIIKSIMDIKLPSEKFVLSCGHAALALYVYLESKGKVDAENIVRRHGVHPERCTECGIDASAGSLGHGLPIAVGMAMATDKNVYCLLSDGECMEGSVWEALRIASTKSLTNLHVHVNANGYSAYGRIDVDVLEDQLNSFFPVVVWRTAPNLPFLQGLHAHYYIPTKEDYDMA